jgi:predicted site-specific integrase-resolvase
VVEEKLVSTAVVARFLGVDSGTVVRYCHRGWLTPARVLPSGQLRWRMSDLPGQLAELRRRLAEEGDE